MALRDQPYFPFYVKDFMTDEKLCECNAESIGVYVWIMCLMHKSEEYGVVLLEQKFKQNANTLLNFAYKLSKHMPFEVEVIDRSLKELIETRVIQLEGDKLLQRRMIRDSSISNARSEAGKKSGFVRTKQATKEPTKTQQNTAIANAIESADEDVIVNKNIKIPIRKGKSKEKPVDIKPKTEKHEYGEYHNVLLSDAELEKLKARFTDWQQRIETLSKGIELHGYKYKNHYLAIINWAENEKPKSPNKETQRDYRSPSDWIG